MSKCKAIIFKTHILFYICSREATQLDFGIIDRDPLKCERVKIARSKVHDLEPILLIQAIASMSHSGEEDSVTYCNTYLDYLFFRDFAALPNKICFLKQSLYSIVLYCLFLGDVPPSLKHQTQ